MFVSLGKFVDAVTEILPECTVYLTGSAAMNDYREGWSDLDLLILSGTALTQDAADVLLNLRQTLSESEPGNSYYRRIEGGVVFAEVFLNCGSGRTVYWGTSDQRITAGYTADVFSLAAMDQWRLLHGEDLRNRMKKPSSEMLCNAVKKHAQTIREHGCTTKNPMYRCGWMLDTARCLYTLKTGRVTAKTNAGEIALRLGWCPDPAALHDALAVRYNPEIEKYDVSDSAILGFLEVLEEVLSRPVVTAPCYCGHDCGRCLVRCGDPSAREFYRDEMGIELKPEEMHCSGGRTESVMKLCWECPMRNCCRSEGILSCIDCRKPCRTYLEYAEQYVNRMGQFTHPDEFVTQST